MMSDSGDNSSTRFLRKRYLRVLRETIRRALESELEKHFENQANLKHYLGKLFGDDCLNPSSVADTAVASKEAEKVVANCNTIHSWFDLKQFWKEQEDHYGSERGHEGFLNVLRRLMVRLHGFWVFTLDDTNHTFRFVSAAAKYDEWGPEPKTAGRADETELNGPAEWPEPSIHFGQGVFYNRGTLEGSEDLKDILKSSLEQYLLRPGEGSVGLGLRADRGVCLRDTVRDLRGAVALEDCIMRNLSYIGLPIFPKEGGENDEKTLGARGRPIGHFGIFFPAPLGWHETLKSSGEWCEHCMFPCTQPERKKADPICLFQRALNLRREIVQPLIAQNYGTLSNERLKSQVLQIAELGNNQKFQNRGVEPSERREVFLREVIREMEKGKGDAVKEETALKIEDFQAVQIWERHAAIAGLSEGAIPSSETATTWRHSVRWKFPDLFFAMIRQRLTDFSLLNNPNSGPWSELEDKDGPWHALARAKFKLDSEPLGERHRILIVQTPSSDSVRDSQLLDAPREFWDKVLVAIESCEPPSSLAEFRSQPSAEGGSDSEIITTKLDECIRKLKWQRLLRNHAAQCLVSRLLPKPLSIKPRRLSTFLFERATNLQELNSKLNEVAQIPQGLSVSILGAADLRLDSIYVGKTLKKMEERLICEVREIGHTLPVFLSLAHAAGKTGLLASDAPYFLANHEPTATARETRDWPIQSEAYHDSSCEHHIDCGTETAFSIPAIWRAWCAELEEKAPELESLGCLDHIHLQTIDASGIRVSLSSSKADNRETMLEFLLVDNTTPRVDFQRVLAHDADLLRDHLETSPVPECELDQTKSNTLTRKVFPEPCSAASRVMAVIARCRENRVRSANQSGSSEQDSSFCVLLAYVGGQPRLEHRILSTNQHIRVPATKEEVAAFEQIASSRHERDILLGKNFGFTTHIFVPISRPSEDASAGRAEQDVGFAVFSSSQVEHDTIRRVEIRPAQQALVTFATDYLEYAISQELQTVDMQESLQEFAHSLRRRGRFMRYGSLAAYTESILPQIARDNGFGDTAALLSSLVNRQAPAALVQHLDNLVRAVGKLSYLKEANADFNVLVNALTFVLANKSEPPLGVGDIDRTSSLDSLENWFNHIATEAKAAEEQRHGSSNCAILIENNLTGTTAITNAPLGSWAIMLEEVIRNAAKHGKPHSVRELTLSINSREITVRCTNEVTTDGSKTDSTLAGFRAIRRLLRVNYGELGKGWNLIRTDESGHFSLLINAKHEFYNRLHSRI